MDCVALMCADNKLYSAQAFEEHAYSLERAILSLQRQTNRSARLNNPSKGSNNHSKKLNNPSKGPDYSSNGLNNPSKELNNPSKRTSVLDFYFKVCGLSPTGGGISFFWKLLNSLFQLSLYFSRYNYIDACKGQLIEMP